MEATAVGHELRALSIEKAFAFRMKRRIRLGVSFLSFSCFDSRGNTRGGGSSCVNMKHEEASQLPSMEEEGEGKTKQTKQGFAVTAQWPREARSHLPLDFLFGEENKALDFFKLLMSFLTETLFHARPQLQHP